MKSRLVLIGMCALLMFGAIYIIGTSLYEERKAAAPATVATNPVSSIPIERGVFARSAEALLYQEMPESQKGLEAYYQNRAYPGAPPIIPHQLISEKGIGGKNCLQCHQNGGYVEQFSAFAPITPHPDLLNCMQCHVPQKTNLAFQATNWEKMAAADIHQVAMPGAPPVIPHDLDMRNNCLSCHAGPSAPKEIRVSHPERVNCRQCHLPRTTPDIFTKPVQENATFKRPGGDEMGYSEQKLDNAEVSQISEWIKNENQ
ncbi:MAG: hypothetical protein MI974_33860 [Chitinophagales bacterium]|nr:hypothetical protein [Chitinophagales bacterium]